MIIVYTRDNSQEHATYHWKPYIESVLNILFKNKRCELTRIYNCAFATAMSERVIFYLSLQVLRSDALHAKESANNIYLY